jgi:formylglycine-generating enzyme required for sulfatase activity
MSLPPHWSTPWESGDPSDLLVLQDWWARQGDPRSAALAEPGWAEWFGLDAFGLYAEVVIEQVVTRFRWIPAGSFLMGSPPGDEEADSDEFPQRAVTLTQPFWLMDAPVTQALWRAVMGENPAHADGADRPVEQISWADVTRFLDVLTSKHALTLQMPTEAQWEYACRAGTQTPRYGELDDVAWFTGNSGGESHPVRQKQPNAWGLYDMLGNVEEWCLDWAGDYALALALDPVGPAEGLHRVMRGACWSDRTEDVRAAYRCSDGSEGRHYDVGVRLARSLTPPTDSETPPT